MSAADGPDIHQLRRELADQLDRYPVETWPEPLLAAVVGVLGLYAADRPKATAPPVLKLVKGRI